MRTILVSGDGSALIAAATALHAAGRGRRTLLLAADDPHRTLDAALGIRLTELPTPCTEHLTAARVDQQQTFRSVLEGFGGRLGPALDLIGATPLDPEELTPLPGTGRLALLRALRTADAEVLVVAAPDPAELIATLALPEQLARYLDRLLPEQRQAARALRPLLAAVAGVPMPADWLFEARTKAADVLAEARAAVERPGTSIRLVVDADHHSLDELRRIRAGFALYGQRLDAVVAHRALPAAALESPDPWLAAQAARERDRLAELAGELGGLPLLVGRRTEPTLEGMAAQLYDERELVPYDTPWQVVDRLADEGLLLWQLALPGADRSELELVRRGDELVVGLGAYRRILPLPSALRRCTVQGAGLAEGVLSIRFAPDPALWPTGWNQDIR
ncbi:ArsA family ATPase [Kitasatospora sp. HPMI-4]|uniref:ArsA family ATPase n=1 Tax=Kitasatospora sp. HPMI-4 TaxID=3448443 RepID=UPI003F1B8A92